MSLEYPDHHTFPKGSLEQLETDAANYRQIADKLIVAARNAERADNRRSFQRKANIYRQQAAGFEAQGRELRAALRQAERHIPKTFKVIRGV